VATIIYVPPDGREQAVDVPRGSSVMQGAVTALVEGIVAECGGNCICATCHVFVGPAQLVLLPAMSHEEDAMLEGTAVKRQPNSRLSCQISVEESLEGLRVHLPECQT
jgi:2Fe-2S ferredoxin